MFAHFPLAGRLFFFLTSPICSVEMNTTQEILERIEMSLCEQYSDLYQKGIVSRLQDFKPVIETLISVSERIIWFQDFWANVESVDPYIHTGLSCADTKGCSPTWRGSSLCMIYMWNIWKNTGTFWKHRASLFPVLGLVSSACYLCNFVS